MENSTEQTKSESLFNLWAFAFLFLLMIYILPIWIFPYFPSQDGPCHIYNSFIIKNYNNPDYVFNQFYNVRKDPIPNWTSHAALTLLMYIMQPLTAERVLLTLYVILMAGSIYYLVGAIEGDRIPLTFIGFPFIYNYLLLMGFYNYSLSVAFMIYAIGYWWRHYGKFNLKDAVILGIILIMLYFSHLVALVLAILAIATASIFSLLPNFKRWKQTLLSLACMLPAIGLAIYYTQTRGTQSGGVWEFKRLWQYFIQNENLAYHSQSQMVFGKIITGVFIALFFYTFFRDRFFTKDWRFRIRLHKKDFFLLFCAAIFVIYLKAPDNMSGGGFIKMRLSFLPFIMIIPWLSWDMPKVFKSIVGVLLILLSTAYIAHASYYHKLLSDDMKIYTSGISEMERNKVVLPLSFNNAGRGWRIGMFLHAVGHYGYSTGCIELDNYEATTNYFPTYFKPEFKRPDHSIIEGKPGEFNIAEYADIIDYVITWSMPVGSDIETRIKEYYDLIKENGNLKIFKRKDDQQDLKTDDIFAKLRN